MPSHLLSIIPLSHSLDTKPLTYVCNHGFFQQLTIGSIVEIPYGKSLDYGMVAWLESDETFPEKELKAVSTVICSTPLLPRYAIDAIMQVAERMYQPIHKIALLFFPRSLLASLAKHTFENLTPPVRTSRNDSSRSIIFHRERRVTPDIILSYLEDKKTVLIFPDDFMLSDFISSLSSEVRDKTCMIPSTLTPHARMKAWKSVYHGETPIVAGTRRLVFFPLEAYAHILYIEDAFSDTYFQFPLRLRYLDFLDAFGPTSPDITLLSSVPSIYALTRLMTFTRKK